MSLRQGDRLCPSCGTPVRRIATAEQRTQLSRLSSALSSAMAGEQEDNDDVVPSAGAGAGNAPISRSEAAARNQQAVTDLSSGVPTTAAAGAGTGMDISGLLQSLMSTLGPATAASGTAGAAGGWDATLMASLQDMMGGGGDGHSTPAAPSAVAALPRVLVTDPHRDLPRTCSLRLTSTGAEIACVPAGFGPPVPSAALGLNGCLVVADPPDCSSDLSKTCTAAMKGDAASSTIGVADRGVVSFAVKAKRCAAAGAAAVVVVNQKGSAWPYVMTDSKGEGSPLPLVMVRYEDGQRIRAAAGSSAILTSASTSDSCAICCEDWTGPQQSTAVIMPCQHAFHEPCLQPWLAKRNTCPLCRSPLPVVDGDDGPADNNQGNDATARVPDPAAAFRRMQRDMQRALHAEREREAVADTWYQ